MTSYLNFKPSKGEVYTKSGRDEFFVFNRDEKILVKEDFFLLPNREDIEKISTRLEETDCIGAYRNRNIYSSRIFSKDGLSGYEFIDLRSYINLIEDETYLSLASRAYMTMKHRENNQRCGFCGGEAYIIDKEEDRAMECSQCGRRAWPANCMAVIVAVTKGDKLLLAHKTGFDNGRYSVLAGFVESGERFEETVMREVYEETGIKVKNIEYFGSQPWPFPNSMMIGFTAQYESGEIRVDGKEISHADWFSKDNLPMVYRNSISIASSLIRWFVENH